MTRLVANLRKRLVSQKGLDDFSDVGSAPGTPIVTPNISPREPLSQALVGAAPKAVYLAGRGSEVVTPSHIEPASMMPRVRSLQIVEEAIAHATVLGSQGDVVSPIFARKIDKQGGGRS